MEIISESNGLPVQQRTSSSGEDDKCSDFDEIMRKLSEAVSNSGISTKKEQEIEVLRREIKEQKKCLQQHLLILSCVKEVANKTDKLSSTTSHKVNRIIVAEQAAQFLQNCPEDCCPLGLVNDFTSNKDAELMYDESVQLQSAVEGMLSEKCCNMKDNEKKESRLRVDKTNLLKLNGELEKAMLEHNTLLEQAFNILKQICDQCVVPLAKMNEVRANCLLKELQSTNMKTKYLECKLNYTINSENKNILPCIEKIDTSVKLEVESASQEFEKFKRLKAKYDEMTQQEEYNKILKGYREVKKNISDKKWLLKQC